jgi:hypothetical protein
VTVNGLALTFDAGRQQYSGSHVIAAGAAIAYRVTIGTSVYDVSATQFTSAPTVTAPTSGATWQRTSAHAISWTGGAPTAGAAYVVGVMDATGDFAFPVPTPDGGGPAELPISTLSYKVPANTLSAGNHSVLMGVGTVGIADQRSGGIAIPGTSSGSGLWLGFVSALIPVTVQ